MNAGLVDTDVISFVFKRHPIGLLYREIDAWDLAISFMTLAELERWAIQSQWGEPKRQRLKEYLTRFAVIPYDKTLCRVWAEVMCAAQSKGFRIDCADAWVAATAVHYGLPLVTHNGDDYRGVPGLSLICHA